MEKGLERAIAVVGLGCTLPDAPDVSTFWTNISEGRYSVSDVTPDRWDPHLYYDPDPQAPDKAYSKIGGWVRKSEWEPVKWRLPIPPRVVDAMDDAQKWAIACTRQALIDYGYPERIVDLDRTAVILGNAMSGEKHYLTALRLYFPEYARELSESSTFTSLPAGVQSDIKRELQNRIARHFPEITEDSMPGELANCIAGRIANLFNLHGPNFVVDAACASAMAAITAAAEGLIEHEFDVAITGGIDRNMGASTFIKFCKIGALSGTGTRPYAEGADGFVMGEGAAIFLLKRLADAETNKDKIYAVLRGIAGSSDGKGKGITAPNPIGQKLCIERAWKNAGLSPASATMIEGHGTSTRVGDVVEVQSFAEVLKDSGLPPQTVALGSVKSNFGHLKGAAGAAGLLKTVLCLHNKTLVPSIHCDRPNPDIDFTRTPLYVNTKLKPWDISKDRVRRAGASAFGFGGTNFHAVLDEYIPGAWSGNGKKSISVPEHEPLQVKVRAETRATTLKNASKTPLRGALVMGASNVKELSDRLKGIQKDPVAVSVTAVPRVEDLRAAERIAIDYGDAIELAEKCNRAVKAIDANQAPVWKALRAQGIFRGRGPAAKIAFLYPGQGSQYINMMRTLRDSEPIVRETFAEADEVMKPLLGKALTEFIFIDQNDPEQVEAAEDALRQTAITQPAVLACDIAITRMLAAFGIEPDMAMGHSLGEYGALVAAGVMSFKDALEGVSARGREMTRVAVADNGRMAAVFAPLQEIERILEKLDGYVVIANINSNSQAVIGGESKSVERAVEAFLQAGYNAVPLPVSHAFHTSIVAPASEPLRQMLRRIELHPPRIPVVANVTGEHYPMGADVVPQIIDVLGQQIAAPVQFIKGLRTLYSEGVRVFVEVGPKKALQGFADDVLGGDPEVLSLFTNHPKFTDAVAFNQALCGMYAAGLGQGMEQIGDTETRMEPVQDSNRSAGVHVPDRMRASAEVAVKTGEIENHSYEELGHYFADVLERGWQMYKPRKTTSVAEPVVITGAGLGLPGTQRIFDDRNIARLLHGEQFISAVPSEFREAMLDKHITRLVKSDRGEPVFETIHDVSEVIKLAGRGGEFDLHEEYGISADRIPALDRSTALAIAAGLDALRDAGIPLVMRYKTTTKGTQLPERWGLSDSMRDDTGVIFASAFPGLNSFAEENRRYYEDLAARKQLATLREIYSNSGDRQSTVAKALADRIGNLERQVRDHPYTFERRFLLRTLPMGHSQFAELIGARGPNTHVNAACASTTQAIAVAEDWIAAGRCRRVIIISADDVTSDSMMGWFGAGFLASGAAATDENVADAAIPFDRRRHGLIVGMGAAALVIESADAAKERGIQPICEVLGAVTANSAYHGTRLDLEHIRRMMDELVKRAERQHGITREDIASRTVFVSHETYTPARGGSASAEINSLRSVFGTAADQIVIANTKGYTGHAMAAGIEDVLAVKSLETGLVPPVANFKEVDPELGELNLSRGGSYPVEFALRLGAGFGSQISMALLRRTVAKDAVRRAPNELGYEYRIADAEAWKNWVQQISKKTNAELVVDHRTLRVRDAVAVDTITRPSAIEPAPVEVVTKSVTEPQSEVIELKLVDASAATSLDPKSIKECVLSLVSAKTGYPIDMLDLELDMEADLGVDTVKQAEVFAAVRERYGIPRDDKLRLRDFPTLAHVIRFVQERTGFFDDVVPAEANEKPGESAPTQVAPAIPTPKQDDVKHRVLALVAEKTGYPIDMLDLDLDMEADLGVDTVKQAEVFASIREIYSIPRDPNLKLRDFPTLAHVIRFVNDRRTDVPAQEQRPKQEQVAAPVAVAVAPTKSETVRDESVQDRILELVVEKTGYPKEMLDLDLDLEADLGIDTVKQAELFASMRAIYGIERDQNLKLRDFPTLKHVIDFVYQKRPDLAGVAEVVVPGIAVTEIVAPESEPMPSNPAEAESMSADKITKIILNIAAEKTGYPVDMLALDLDLEADLGVDTVKQAEMFASVRQAFNIPRSEDLKLRDFPTLGHVIAFAKSHAPTSSTNAPFEAAQEPQQVKQIPRKMGGFEAANRIPRRIPIPLLRAPLELCKATGVTLDANSRVVIMPDVAGVAKELESMLRDRGVSVLTLHRSTDPQQELQAWVKEGSIQGVYWLCGMDDHPPLSIMSVTEWRQESQARVKSLYSCMRNLYDFVAQKNTFLISASALGGQHGYDEAGATVPLGGAVTGFTKSYKREQKDAMVKAIDFEPNKPARDIAAHLIEETLRDPGVVEIGFKSGLRWTIGLYEHPINDAEQGLTLNDGTVFLVTGAAGSIVSAIISDLAAASGGIFYLLDLVPEPNPHDPDLQRLTADKDGLKRDLFGRIQARGERATPAMVEKELARLERARAALDGIEAIRNAGGKAHYRSLDITDSSAVSGVIEEIRKTHGRIDVLIHAAGLERSHFLPDKQPNDFNLVFDVKADGFLNLVRAIGEMPLGAVVAFSSIAGRFGNAGQADYSAANDLLCKVVSSMRRTHPATRAIAIDWSAWKDIGMASRGSIPKMMEIAGIDMISPEAGVPIVRRELTLSNFSGEVLIGERLGVLLQESDTDSCLDDSKVTLHLSQLGPMVGNFSAQSINGELAVETRLEPNVQPFLFDHRIDGTPVLPGVMGMEAFAEAALSILPNWRVDSIKNVNFAAPFKFYRNEPRSFTTKVHFRTNREHVIADCTLNSTRSLPGKPDPQITSHFTATVQLTNAQVPPKTVRNKLILIEPVVEKSNIYQIYFHGPAYQVIARAWRDGEHMIGEMSSSLPANHVPSERRTVIEPRVIELCLQTAGLWELTAYQRLGLPLSIDEVRFHRGTLDHDGTLFAVVTPDERHGIFNAEVIDSVGEVYCEVIGYRTVTFINEVDASPLKWLQTVVA